MMAVVTATAREGSTAAALAFLRFVLCGGGVTLLGSGALLLAGDRVPVAAANAVVTVATTVLATELHGRFTFGRGRARWSDHCASGLTVLMSYLFTTGALLAFDALRPDSGALLRQGVYLAASGLAGIGRFLLLRLVVFAGAGSAGPKRTELGRTPRAAVRGADLAPAEAAGAGASAKNRGTRAGAPALARRSVTVAA